ncbi:MAG: hypothetical protein J7J30_02295 [Candidatus Odinarchaeota archaeon]|nr:hypothetical protein [Candidatus Odinarchaeota archaeon]
MQKILGNIKSYLEKFKEIYGVETVILTQKDGFPISIVGVWLSEEEVFGVCSSSSAIYAAAQQLSGGQLNYLFIEGTRVNMMISPLQDLREFCCTIVTKPKVNLGAIFLRIREDFFNLRNILLKLSDIKPPLRNFTEKEIRSILRTFSVRPGEEDFNKIRHEMFELSDGLFEKIRNKLRELLTLIQDIEMISLIYEGGYSLLTLSRTAEFCETSGEDVLAYSLVDTAARLMWITKKTMVKQITCDCNRFMYFIYDLEGCVLVIKLVKRKAKLGFLRLVINSYIDKVKATLLEGKVKTAILPKISSIEKLQLAL